MNAVFVSMLVQAALPIVPVADAGAELIGQGADRFGYASASGDLDANGKTDVVVTAPDPLGGNTVYVFFGAHTLDGTTTLDPTNADVAISGGVSDETGWSVTVGDVIGDESIDLIIGSPADGANGEVQVFEGPLMSGNYLTSDADYTIRGNVFGYAGWSVAAGDFDGDGKDELALGACAAGVGGAGRVWIVDADTNAPVDTAGATARYDGVGLTGCSLANAGDFNGDGYEELLIGSYGSFQLSGLSWGGAVSIVYGRAALGGTYALGVADPTTIDVAHLHGESTGSNFGFSIAPAGDLNVDGYDDFLVGAPSNECPMCAPPLEGLGRAYVILGAPDDGPGGASERPLVGNSLVSDVADLIFDADAPGDSTGVSVSGAGWVGTLYGRFTSPVLQPNPLSYGPVMLFGTRDDFAYAIAYDHRPTLNVPPDYKCVQDPDGGHSCMSLVAAGPKARKKRVLLGKMSYGGHRFVGDIGSAFGSNVLGTGDLDGDGGGDLFFGAPYQYLYEDPAGDGEAFIFGGR